MKNNKLLDFLTLFSSAGTLICCALPALLVAIGAGSVMASLVSNVPGIIWISRYKIPVFIFAGCMLATSGLLRLFAKQVACPVDENLSSVCGSAKKISSYVFQFSLFLYFVGLFFAFIAPRFL